MTTREMTAESTPRVAMGEYLTAGLTVLGIVLALFV